jgi:hypothetical protein
MFYLLIGFASAALFGIGAAGIYGSDALLKQAWVDHVFWALIFAGAALAALENASGLWCRLCQRLSGVVTLCQRTPCGQAAG